MIRLFRWPNLLIVVLTQWLVYDLIRQQFSLYDIPILLDPIHFGLFILSTLIITAGGYLINDIFDYDIDLINKPERQVIGRVISIGQAQWLYHGLNSLGFLLSFYLAYHISNLPLVLIYPVAVALLYWYSWRGKRAGASGNLVVALFCAFVAGIVFFAERAGFVAYLQIAESPQILKDILIFYSLYAFISTLLREIVKDTEDMAGDRAADCRTIPIRYGVSNAKKVAISLAIALLILSIYWSIYQIQVLANWWGLGFVILLILGPNLFVLYLLRLARQTADFSRLSRWTKYLMAAGILYLIFLKIILI